MSWHDAMDYCNANGGRLAEIYDSATNDLVKAVCTGGFIYYILTIVLLSMRFKLKAVQFSDVSIKYEIIKEHLLIT